jgi:hypothetical protein
MERTDLAAVVPVLNDYPDATRTIAVHHDSNRAPNSITARTRPGS